MIRHALVLAGVLAAAALGACGGSEEADPRGSTEPCPHRNVDIEAVDIAFTRFTLPNEFGDIFVMSADGNKKTNLTHSPEISEEFPAWSPDGTRIAYGRQVGKFTDIWVMCADGSEQRNLTETPGLSENDPAWSPDGDRIAFTSGRIGQDLFVMDSAGGEPTNLTKSPDRSEASPAFSPDGKRIAFSSNGIHVINRDGSGKTNLSEGICVLTAFPAFSPDGKRIAFFGRVPGAESGRAWMMKADGSDAAPLAHGPRLSSGPEFSPDGRQIAFEGANPRRPGIYVMNADGSWRVRLTNHDNDQKPAWSPASNGLPR